ncbi:MAG: 5'/3'-nucleotidase SurE [Bacteroidota bacterium]|nr:5'/3'-nucleotidase SurE [Bacteroidota bacterium]
MNEQSKPLILVTNDDGITAPGIQNLITIAQEFGNVVVVAPDSPQSGKGHAVTVNNTLYINKISENQYSCSGTPVDCVKMAVHEILGKKPDLCISGINHGSNSSINVIYSGTMSAAVEAGIEGIPAIGFSLADFSWNADFAPCLPFVRRMIAHTLKNELPKGVVLNVNFPKTDNIKGIKICRQANAAWIERFDKRQTPHGRDYYWLTGEFVNYDKGEDTDEFALANGYVSVVPVQFDLTAHFAINTLNNWKLNE